MVSKDDRSVFGGTILTLGQGNLRGFMEDPEYLVSRSRSERECVL